MSETGHIIDRQTLIFSVNLRTMTGVNNPSQIQLAANLRFVADGLILKSINYNRNNAADVDLPDVIQIWTSITDGNIIGAFTNASAGPVNQQHNEHFRLSNSFQSGNFTMQFQRTDQNTGPIYNNPQTLISTQAAQRTFGTVVLTIEFVKHSK